MSKAGVAHGSPAETSLQIGARLIGGGRLSAVFTVRTLVQLAYGYPDTLIDAQVVGGPSWIDTDRFEIKATFDGPIALAPNSAPVRLLAMDRTLLADRFKLKVHQETRPLPVFDLVRSRGDGRLGPRLVRSDGSCLPLPATPAPISDYSPYCGVKRSTRTAMSAKGIPLSRFALLLSFVPDVQRIVRDRTGQTEAFDLDIEFAPVGSAEAQDLPPITTALKEQLGLEFAAGHGTGQRDRHRLRRAANTGLIRKQIQRLPDPVPTKYTAGLLRADAAQQCTRMGEPHRGPDPVQLQPANRVRAGRQQR